MRMKLFAGMAVLALAACSEAPKEIVYTDPTVTIEGQAVALTQGDMMEAVAVAPGDTLAQSFKACAPFDGLQVSIVTWTAQPSPYPVGWTLKGGDGKEIGSGYFEAAKLTDWQKVSLPAKGAAGDFVLEVASPAGDPVEKPAGIVIAPPSTASTAVATRNGRAVAKPGAIQLWTVGPNAAACPA